MNTTAQTAPATTEATAAVLCDNLFDYLDLDSVYETDKAKYGILLDICDEIAYAAISCGDDDPYIEADGDAYHVSMSARCTFVDYGIGPYEYWGARCVDHQWEPECDEGDFRIELNDEFLAKIGLIGSATSDGEIDYSDVAEDGDYAKCSERVTFFVDDPAKFDAYLAKELAERKAKAA